MVLEDFTPWQRMRAYEKQVRKIEDNWRILSRKYCPQKEEGVIYAETNECKPFLTYYNNEKENICCKPLHDYNYPKKYFPIGDPYLCGYDQTRHRCDRKHHFVYMNLHHEEVYPCRTVPLLTNSNYGHRKPIDPMRPIAKKKVMNLFYRNHCTAKCFEANAINEVRPNPSWAFKANQSCGYTYAPPIN